MRHGLLRIISVIHNVRIDRSRFDDPPKQFKRPQPLQLQVDRIHGPKVVELVDAAHDLVVHNEALGDKKPHPARLLALADGFLDPAIRLPRPGPWRERCVQNVDRFRILPIRQEDLN